MGAPISPPKEEQLCRSPVASQIWEGVLPWSNWAYFYISELVLRPTTKEDLKKC